MVVLRFPLLVLVASAVLAAPAGASKRAERHHGVQLPAVQEMAADAAVAHHHGAPDHCCDGEQNRTACPRDLALLHDIACAIRVEDGAALRYTRPAAPEGHAVRTEIPPPRPA